MTLEQRFGLFGRQRLVLLEDKLVRRLENVGSSTEDAFLLEECAENPVRVRRIAWGWFAASTVLLSLSGLFLYHAVNERREPEPLYTLAAVWGVGAIITLLTAVRRTFHVIVFDTARGGIVIRHDRPTPEACREFVQALQQKVTENRSVEKRTIRTVLLVLHNEEYLDEWKYHKARERFGVVSDE